MSIRFYNDDDKLRPELLDEEARNWANRLVTARERNLNGVSKHQFRRLFEEAKRLQRSMDKEWESTFPMVKMLKSKTAYAVARAKEKDKWSRDNYDALKTMFDEGISQVKTAEDYNIFCLFLEAVYGFYYELGGSRLNK